MQYSGICNIFGSGENGKNIHVDLILYVYFLYLKYFTGNSAANKWLYCNYCYSKSFNSVWKLEKVRKQKNKGKQGKNGTSREKVSGKENLMLQN